MARRKRNPIDPFISQAAAQALVRYGPELSGLKALAQAAQSEYAGSVSSARGQAAATQKAIDMAVPQVQKTYDQAGLKAAAVAGTLMNRDLAALPGTANSIKAAGAVEAAGMAGRLNEARAGTIGDLAQQRVQSVAGAGFAKQAARAKLAGDIAKILGRQSDIQQESGAFQAQVVGDLVESAAERRSRERIARGQRQATERNSIRSTSQSERNSIRSSGIDPDTGKVIKGGPLDPKAKKDGKKGPGNRVSQGEHNTLADRISNARADAERLGLPRPQAGKILLGGRPEATLELSPEQAKKRGLKDPKLKVPAVPKYGQVTATVALDLVESGGKGISRATMRKLHEKGYSVKALGLRVLTPREEQWFRTKRTLGQVVKTF